MPLSFIAIVFLFVFLLVFFLVLGGFLTYSPLNPTLQLAVGHAVLLKEAGGKLIPSLRCNILNVRRGDNSSDEGGRRIYDVLLSRL